MLLRIEKIGKIKEADIQIDGIAVIAGENNSGKSTVGKTLFCIFNTLYNIDEKLKQERINYITEAILKKLFRTGNIRLYHRHVRNINTSLEEIAKNILEKKEEDKNDKNKFDSYLKDTLKKHLSKFLSEEKFLSDKDLNEISKDIFLSFDITDETIVKSLFSQVMESEFGMQINNVNDEKKESNITLKVKDTEIKIKIKNDTIEDISNFIDIYVEAVYIDNPYAAENNDTSLEHREHLSECLINEKNKDKKVLASLVANKKIESILKDLNLVSPGEIIMNDDDDFVYHEGDTSKAIKIMNVSTGIKTFAIIKKLLLDGYIEENGTIILDEPEIHLHPEWQIILAELIVLIQKELNMHILLTTHSPYFLEGIEVYSKKHGIDKKCKYYLAEVSDRETTFKDVSENTEAIYKKFAKPFEILERAPFSND